MPADLAVKLQIAREELARLYAERKATRRLARQSRPAIWLRWKWLVVPLRGAVWLFAGRYAFLTHFINRRSIQRSGLFDGAWYLQTYPDVLRARRGPLCHYVQFGAAEGRRPSPAFDPDWYRLQYPHVTALRMNPLVHYIRRGAARGLSPLPDLPRSAFFKNWPGRDARSLGHLRSAGRRIQFFRPEQKSILRLARTTLRPPESEAQAGAGRRVCLFSHFDPQGMILGYVRYYLDALLGQGFEIHFVSTSPCLDADDQAAMQSQGVKIHLRANMGRDFGSWQWALRAIPEIQDADTLLLANDSVFGPLFDLSELFAAMLSEPADVWGITNSFEQRWHLQSYFLCLSRRACRSRAFERLFAKPLQTMQDKKKIVRRGEILLSQLLVADGLVVGAYCPYEQLSPVYGFNRKPVNPTFFYWEELIVEQRCPFLKREVVVEESHGTQLPERWKSVIGANTDYDTSLIEEYLRQIGRRKHPLGSGKSTEIATFVQSD